MKTISFEEYINKQTPEFKTAVDKLVDKFHKKLLKRKKYKIRLRRKKYKYYMLQIIKSR